MTFRSDEEYWAWLDRQARWRERLCRWARYLAIMGAATLVLFAFMYFIVRHMGESRYDHWQETLRSARIEGG